MGLGIYENVVNTANNHLYLLIGIFIVIGIAIIYRYF